MAGAESAGVQIEAGGGGLDWKAAVVTFGLVFVAEMGDKTQLATMMMAARTRSLLPVFLGAAAALVLSALIGAVAGDTVARFVPIKTLQTVAGLGFVAIGLLLLSGRL